MHRLADRYQSYQLDRGIPTLAYTPIRRDVFPLHWTARRPYARVAALPAVHMIPCGRYPVRHGAQTPIGRLRIGTRI